MKTKGYTIEDGKVIESEYWDSKEEAYEALVAELHSQVAALAASAPPVTHIERPEQLEMAFPPAKERRRRRCRLAWRVRVLFEGGGERMYRNYLEACKALAQGNLPKASVDEAYYSTRASTPAEMAEKRCETLCGIIRRSGSPARIASVVSYGLGGEIYAVDASRYTAEAGQ